MVSRTVRRSRVMLAVVVFVAAAAGGTYLRSMTADDETAARPSYAVVYARSRWIAETHSSYVDVWWQRLPEEEPRLVCTVQGYGGPTYLPSPDGRWLYVSHEVDERRGTPSATRSFIVSLPDGKVVPLAEVQWVPRGGSRGFTLTFALHWLDDSRLLLASNVGSAVFDVEEREFAAALPEWPPKTLPESAYRYTSLPAPQDFVREHYADELRCAQEAMATFGAEMGLDDYLAASDYPEPDTLETMLARPLGIFALSGYRGNKRAWPSLACSPNHRYVARAAILPTDDAVQWKDLEGNWQSGRLTAIRLDFFDLVEEDHQPFVSDRWPGYARDGRPFRAGMIPEWMAPRLTDLRFSPDGRFFSYTARDILPPPGAPSRRGGASVVRVQGRVRHGFPHTGVYVYDTGWMTGDPCEGEDPDDPYEHLYFIPDAYNAFVVPAAVQLDPP